MLKVPTPEPDQQPRWTGDLAQAHPRHETISSPSAKPESRWQSNLDSQSIYGLDRGLPDLDVPRNNGNAATNTIPPSNPGSQENQLKNLYSGGPQHSFDPQKPNSVFSVGGYFASPVPIKIPMELAPLSSILLENPMNLMYFHHFLNHTARILVVHDCSKNPFRTLLPQSKPAS